MTKERILKPSSQVSGRKAVTLCLNNKPVRFSVARLVAAAFIGPANGLLVLHKDDDKTNDTLDNLRYGTVQDNSDDMVRNGTSLKGERHHKAKLKSSQVLETKKSLLAGEDHHVLAGLYYVSVETIQSIKHGRNWGWLKLPNLN